VPAVRGDAALLCSSEKQVAVQCSAPTRSAQVGQVGTLNPGLLFGPSQLPSSHGISDREED
jgi:hypothetical protein